MGLGVADRRLGRLDEAKKAALESHALLQKLGDRNRVLVLHNLATVEGDQGLWHLALPKFETCREAYKVFGWPAHEAALVDGRLLGLRGKLRLAQGDVQWGRELLQASACILRYFADKEAVERVAQLLEVRADA